MMDIKTLNLLTLIFFVLTSPRHSTAGESIMTRSSNSENIMARQLIDKLYEGIPQEIKGHRVNHAKGIVLSGTFTPTKQAKQISTAPHFATTTPIIVRLSNSTGIPDIEDQNPKASPRGIAIRFKLRNQQITDLIGHSVEGFPVDTPEEFIKFLSIANQASNKPDQFSEYVETHLASKRFFSLLGRTPQSFATTAFYPLHAFKFINKDKTITIGRYIIQPVQGVHYLNEEQAKAKDKNFLSLELRDQLKKAPVQYRLLLQIANPTDDLMHISQPWHGEHKIIDLGRISLTDVLDNQIIADQSLIFDPTRLSSGIESVKDPMFEIRSPAYQLSKIRRTE